jgi:hypothetical protein
MNQNPNPKYLAQNPNPSGIKGATLTTITGEMAPRRRSHPQVNVAHWRVVSRAAPLPSRLIRQTATSTRSLLTVGEERNELGLV